MPNLSVKDLAAGLIFGAIGAFFLVGSLSLEVGTAFRMGPGYFPLLLSGILIALGAAMSIRSFAAAYEPLEGAPWRGVALILAAIAAFGASVRGLGLVAALAVAVLVTTFASRRMTLPMAVMLTLALTVFCVAVFSYGLGLPLRLKGPWLSF